MIELSDRILNKSDQYVKGSNGKKNDNKLQQIGNISRQVKSRKSKNKMVFFLKAVREIKNVSCKLISRIGIAEEKNQ